MDNSRSVLSYLSVNEIFADSDEITLVIGRTGAIILVNQRGKQLLEHPDRKLEGGSWFNDFVASSGSSESYSAFLDSLSQPEFVQEYPVVLGDQRELKMRWRNRVVRDEDGIVMCILLSGHTTGASSQEGDLYRSLVDNSLQGLVIAQDEPLRISFASSRMEDISGYTPAELMSMTTPQIIDLIYPDDREQFFTNFRSRLAGLDPPVSSEYRVLHRSGDIKWVRMYSNRVEYDGGTATQTVFLDITDSIHARESLKQSEEKYRSLVENSNDAIIIHVNGAIVFANETAKRVTGYDESDFIGASILDFIAPRFEATILKNMTDRISGREVPSIYNIEVQTKSGDLIPVEINISKVPYEGEYAYMVLFRDLTERRALEIQMRQVQKMEAVGQLAGGVAHDFNNILQVINGYTELARNSLSDDDPLVEMLQQISSAGSRAEEMVSKLMVFSKNQMMTARLLDINSVISDQLSVLKRVIGERIKLVFTPSEDSLYVNADESMLDQILMNLCLNARDALPSGGEVTVTTESVHLDVDFCEMNPMVQPGQYALMIVSDSGEGMDEATLDRIFEPFFSTKGITEGTGLGLSTVYGIVSQHDGMVRAESSPGEGSKFFVYLPMIEEHVVVEDIPVEYEMEETVSRTIVLAEDDENVMNLAMEILTEAGHEVISATNGKEAVLMVHDAADSIDLVILDAVMPEMNGFEAAEKIREINPGMPIVFCSGYSSENGSRYMDRFRESCRFIKKPYSMHQLLSIINELSSDSEREKE